MKKAFDIVIAVPETQGTFTPAKYTVMTIPAEALDQFLKDYDAQENFMRSAIQKLLLQGAFSKLEAGEKNQWEQKLNGTRDPIQGRE